MQFGDTADLKICATSGTTPWLHSTENSEEPKKFPAVPDFAGEKHRTTIHSVALPWQARIRATKSGEFCRRPFANCIGFACMRLDDRTSQEPMMPASASVTKSNSPDRDRSSLTRFAWLSIAAAIVTIGLKTVAYLLTGSVGLLSDAVESLVNLIGGIMALAMLTIAARPADEDHAFGHSKAEYFSSLVEGGLILLAAASIGYASMERLFAPKPLDQVGLGLVVSVGASAVNWIVAMVLLRVGRRQNSITLEANAHHLMTDVWTSVGVLVGVCAVALTGWQRLDPIVALIVAANIVWTGVGIMRRSVSGLMDVALSHQDRDALNQVLQTHEKTGIRICNLRSRQSGSRVFVSMIVQVPGEWTVRQGHAVLDCIEHDIQQALPHSDVTIHMEALDDSSSKAVPSCPPLA
jgi:cation diffusion facilitator family transporter